MVAFFSRDFCVATKWTEWVPRQSRIISRKYSAELEVRYGYVLFKISLRHKNGQNVYHGKRALSREKFVREHELRYVYVIFNIFLCHGIKRGGHVAIGFGT